MQLPPLKAGEVERDVDAAHESYDPLDEALELFRANTFFRNFEIKGPADRLLIYGILFVQEILGKIKSSTSLPIFGWRGADWGQAWRGGTRRRRS
jgi:actin related protein 2/3 complex, subunit 3